MTRNHVRPPPQNASATRLSDASASESSSRHREAPPNKTSFSSDGTLTPDSQYDDLIKMADAMSVMSPGTLAAVGRGEIPENPVMQCVQIKPMASQNGAERYRIVMNDTEHFIQAMLGQRESNESPE